MPSKIVSFDIEGLAPAAPVKKDSGIDLTLFVDTLRKSWEAKQRGDSQPAFTMSVPVAQVSSLKTRFQQAAKQLGLGVAFNTATPQNGKQAVTVEARKKKVMPPKKTAGATAEPVKTAGTGLPAPAKQTAKR